VDSIFLRRRIVSPRHTPARQWFNLATQHSCLRFHRANCGHEGAVITGPDLNVANCAAKRLAVNVNASKCERDWILSLSGQDKEKPLFNFSYAERFV
jgi:hypothetical protein